MTLFASLILARRRILRSCLGHWRSRAFQLLLFPVYPYSTWFLLRAICFLMKTNCSFRLLFEPLSWLMKILSGLHLKPCRSFKCWLRCFLRNCCYLLGALLHQNRVLLCCSDDRASIFLMTCAILFPPPKAANGAQILPYGPTSWAQVIVVLIPVEILTLPSIHATQTAAHLVLLTQCQGHPHWSQLWRLNYF